MVKQENVTILKMGKMLNKYLHYVIMKKEEYQLARMIILLQLQGKVIIINHFVVKQDILERVMISGTYVYQLHIQMVKQKRHKYLQILVLIQHVLMKNGHWNDFHMTFIKHQGDWYCIHQVEKYVQNNVYG